MVRCSIVVLKSLGNDLFPPHCMLRLAGAYINPTDKSMRMEQVKVRSGGVVIAPHHHFSPLSRLTGIFK